jgi:hypothetical protein
MPKFFILTGDFSGILKPRMMMVRDFSFRAAESEHNPLDM